MSDEPTGEATPAVTDPTPQAGTTTDAPAATSTTTSEAVPADVQKLIDEAATKASQKANAEAQSLRNRLKELEAAERTRKDADLSDLERATKAAAEAAERATKAEGDARAAKIEAAVTREAARVNVDPALLLKLADGITLGDDGTPTGVAEVVDQLVAAHPNLVQSPAPQQSPTNPARGGATPQMTDAQRLASMQRGSSANPWQGGGAMLLPS